MAVPQNPALLLLSSMHCANLSESTQKPFFILPVALCGPKVQLHNSNFLLNRLLFLLKPSNRCCPSPRKVYTFWKIFWNLNLIVPVPRRAEVRQVQQHAGALLHGPTKAWDLLMEEDSSASDCAYLALRQMGFGWSAGSTPLGLLVGSVGNSVPVNIFTPLPLLAFSNSTSPGEASGKQKIRSIKVLQHSAPYP